MSAGDGLGFWKQRDNWADDKPTICQELTELREDITELRRVVAMMHKHDQETGEALADLAARIGNVERAGERLAQYTSTAMPEPEWEPTE